ncbi:hypothetical protein PTSG_09005 [Salpingoeca rosetta]|uniref:Uncharacterized protein n=1 Tax=Salpingoeca rosetta (strain ATCC 50818 / BSB-021) TaxID=946362 RepID=F2ULX8_SALR5|nr:uncharacterized protein PTSG_09005 [Salpingoeca rosetta]EGD78127.1 hypothetical protein PTSG_09005 [Salpingoeca rosetta]|eukprot:XP_004989803.1 hypothetical protein PTSG_09005 [Salpingoeca rosetta]
MADSPSTHRRRRPFGFRSLANPGRHVWRPPRPPSARSSTTTPSTRLWFAQTNGPLAWWVLSLVTGNLNPEEETVEEVQHESGAHPRAQAGVLDWRGPAATTCCSARSWTDNEYRLTTQPSDKAAGRRAR